MSFQPVLPIGGYAGWTFLQRTMPRQAEVHAAQPAARRDADHFRAAIASVRSPDDLIADRRLLRVALEAFGLGDDLPHRAFVRKVLESSTLDPASFVNRLSDSRYRQFAAAFGFGDAATPYNTLPGFADRVLTSWHERRFEADVGQQDPSMRLALGLERDLGRLARQDSSETTKWYTVLGTPALRKVFETAFNLPSAFGAIDVDKQVEVLRERTERLTGSDSVSQFAEPGALDRLVRRFFLAEQVSQITGASAQGSALTLLQQGQASLRQMLGR